MTREETNLVQSLDIASWPVISNSQHLRGSEHHPQARPHLLQAVDELLGNSFVPETKSIN